MTDPIDVTALAVEQMRAARRLDDALRAYHAETAGGKWSQLPTAVADEVRAARQHLKDVEARYRAACDAALTPTAGDDDDQFELGL